MKILDKNSLLLLFFVFIVISFFTNYQNILLAKDLSIDERVNEISKQLRCMTCQNQNVYESESEFSNQIKKEISNQLKQKKSKAEIIDFMVERYGEYILLKPKLDAKNTILWTMPFIIIIISFWLLFLKIRSNKE